MTQLTEKQQLSRAVARYERLRRVRHRWRSEAGRTWCKRCGVMLRLGVDPESMCGSVLTGALDFSGPPATEEQQLGLGAEARDE